MSVNLTPTSGREPSRPVAGRGALHGGRRDQVAETFLDREVDDVAMPEGECVPAPAPQVPDADHRNDRSDDGQPTDPRPVRGHRASCCSTSLCSDRPALTYPREPSPCRPAGCTPAFGRGRGRPCPPPPLSSPRSPER